MQLIGIPLSLLLGLIFLVGSQTFTASGEKLFANFMLGYCIILFFTSILSVFLKSLRVSNSSLTIGAMLVAALGWAIGKHLITL